MAMVLSRWSIASRREGLHLLCTWAVAFPVLSVETGLASVFKARTAESSRQIQSSYECVPLKN